MSDNNFWSHFWPFQTDWPFWMSKIHFRWHFWPFQNHTELSFIFKFWQNGRRRPFWVSKNNFRWHFWVFEIDRPFWISQNHFLSHIWPFQIDRPFWMSKIHFLWHFWPFFFGIFVTKWPPVAILDGTTMSIIELVRDNWMSNACVKFEERSLNPSKVIVLTRKLWRGGPYLCGGIGIRLWYTYGPQYMYTCIRTRRPHKVIVSARNTLSYDVCLRHKAWAEGWYIKYCRQCLALSM